jgi:hypothetical protein
VSDDMAVFSGENSGTDWFFWQISGETSTSSIGHVSTPISMIFISPIYVVPQNRVRSRRQLIVYYWRNDTNTLLNLVQSHIIHVSLLHSVFLSNLLFFTLTVALSSSLCTSSAHFTHLHSLVSFLNIMAEKERVVDGGEGG